MSKTFPKLRGRMVEKFGSVEGFAKAAGIPKNTIYCKLLKKRKITSDDMKSWGEILEIPQNEYYDYYF